MSSATIAQSDLPAVPPNGTGPLNGNEIRALLGGGTDFNFVGVTAPISGTGYWDLDTGTAYGRFEIDHAIKGNWGFPWFVDGDLNCLRYSPSRTVCTHIYPHGDGGFMEVNLDGTVHTIYTPMRSQPLPMALSAERVRSLLTHFLAWNQEPEIKVGSVLRDGDDLMATLETAEGKPAWTLQINQQTGFSRVYRGNRKDK